LVRIGRSTGVAAAAAVVVVVVVAIGADRIVALDAWFAKHILYQSKLE